jgi:DNA-binding MarR family transcriptional regulator
MAESARVIEFKLPKRRPKIVEKVAPPDQRKFAVLPMAAVMDKELHGFTVKVLAVLCSYCNRAGLTWVGQQRIADHLGVAKQQVARAMKQLRDRGHIEVVSKGFRGERANTVRVVFAADITAQDAIAVTSGQEDTRPPEMRRKEAREMTEKEFTPEQIAANKERLKELLSAFNRKGSTTHQLQPIGDVLMARKPAPKRTKKTPNIDNTQVVHVEPSIDNIIDNTGVVQTQKNIGIDKVLGVYEHKIKTRFNLSVKTTEVDLRFVELLCQVKMDDQRFIDAVEALTEPKRLADICADLIEG